MRPNHGRTLLYVSVFAVLFLTFKADGDDSECENGVTVRRNTKYEAVVGTELRVECPVVFCNTSPPTVLWYKDKKHVDVNDGNIETQWKRLHKSAGISYLIIRNIHINDEGLYQCEIATNIGHNINVSVKEPTGPVEQNSTVQENDTSQKDDDISKMGSWVYVYSAAGIASFVIIVIIISFISMRGCKGKSNRKTPTENPYAEIVLMEQPFHPSPRGSPCVQPPRRWSKRRSPKQPKESRSSRDGEQMKENRDSRAAVPEVEDGSVVYAALNHDLPHRPAARPMMVAEGASEYAAIRVL